MDPDFKVMTITRRGFFLALEFRSLRRGAGLFFSTRLFLGRGFSNTSMSLAFKMESLLRFIAAIIRSRAYPAHVYPYPACLKKFLHS